ncbi:hypothetical protein [Methylotuvimicrobium sp. KM1]|uniref:hypothetical protein n=1 Tax=Methylotuvimicrobium sp. KM1 TaxID=3377707 RepID=UPI00384FFB15
MTHQIRTKQNASLPFLVWDTCDIAIQQAKILLEHGEADDEDDAFRKACEDQDLLDFEWESLTDCLSETLQAINPDGYWHAEVEKFGWRKLNGYADFQAGNGKTFLENILPQTDCTFKVFLEQDTIRIQNAHHDSPTGNEWYTVRPAKARGDEFQEEFAEIA